MMSQRSFVRQTDGLRLFSLICALLAVVALLLTPSTAHAKGGPGGSITPTGVTVTLATTQAGLGGAVPGVLAQAGITPITLTLTLAPTGAVFNQDATFALDVSLVGGATPSGLLRPGQVVLPAGQTSLTSTVTYSAVDNGVVVSPRLTGRLAKNYALAAAAGAPFDSLKRLSIVAAGEGPVMVGSATCAAGGPDLECATVSLPNGSDSANAATAVGTCTTPSGYPSPADLPCPTGSEVVGFIADLGTRYNRNAPAQVTIRCAKARCGRGGVNSYVVRMTFEATGPLDITSKPCVAKGVADDGQGHDWCTDYVASRRDGSGDLLLVVNVTHDYRGAV